MQPDIVEGEKGWRVGFVNVQGWKSKEVEVGQLLKEQDFDVFGVVETFLRNDWEVQMEGYKYSLGLEGQEEGKQVGE